jgi:hypothetical protein
MTHKYTGFILARHVYLKNIEQVWYHLFQWNCKMQAKTNVHALQDGRMKCKA